MHEQFAGDCCQNGLGDVAGKAIVSGLICGAFGAVIYWIGYAGKGKGKDKNDDDE